MERRKEIQEKANELYHSHTPYEATIAMAEWADETMINKAVKYLNKLTRCAVSCIGEDVYVPVLNKEQLEDFKKSMKK